MMPGVGSSQCVGAWGGGGAQVALLGPCPLKSNTTQSCLCYRGSNSGNTVVIIVSLIQTKYVNINCKHEVDHCCSSTLGILFS